MRVPMNTVRSLLFLRPTPPIFRTRLRYLDILNRHEISTSTPSFYGHVYLPHTQTKIKQGQELNPSNTVPEIVPLLFSSMLKEKMSPSRMSRFQKIYNDTQSIFISGLAQVRDVSEVVDLIEKHAEIMDIGCLNAGMEILFMLLKDEKYAPRRKDFLNSVGVQKLLKLLRHKCRSMQPGDVTSGLKLLSMLGVPGSDTNVQILLKVLTKHANSLELVELMYLSFILKRFSKDGETPLCIALEMALPVVFESKISSQNQNGELQQQDVQLLCDYLHYSTDRNLSSKTVKILVDVIERNLNSLAPKHAMSILWSLGDAKTSEPYQESLVKTCFRTCTENMGSFDLSVLSTAVSKANRKFVVKKIPYFYDEDFIHSYCNRLMSRQSDREHTLFSLKTISLFRHVHVEYMDRVGEIIASNPSIVLNNDYLFFSLMKAFSGCNYKPEKWNKFEAMLLNHPVLSKDLGPQSIHLAVDFLALEIYPEVLIHKVFSPEELPKLDSFLYKTPFPSTAAHSLLLILNSIQYIYPQYAGPLPPTSMINKWKEVAREGPTNINRNISLKSALQTGFGGENYVINGVYHNGFHIDHVIVLRKGGYPIAVNQVTEIKDVADIQKPSESEIVLVKVFGKDAYSNNTPRLRGIKALEQRILEKLGHPIIVVDGERWTQLSDHEKIPFLMHRIREKIDKLQWNQAGSSDVIPIPR